MYNLIILGSARSGTSMTAALFRSAGYYLGDRLLDATEANPYGYYEDESVIDVNSQIIARGIFWKSLNSWFPWALNPVHRDYRASWMAAPVFLAPRKMTPGLDREIRRLVGQAPFCFKDPRFNVTLPAWRPYLPDATRFLVVFREPDRTVNSILKVVHIFDPPVFVTPEWAYVHWERHYRRLLDRFSDEKSWLFVDYNSIAQGRATDAIRSFSEAELDLTQIDPSVSRSKPSQHQGIPAARRCLGLYERLLERSARDLARWGAPDAGSRAPAPAAANSPITAE